MYKSRWIIAVAFGIALLASNAWPQAASENQPRQKESTSAGSNSRADEKNQPVGILPALEGIEAAIRDLITEEDKVAAERKQSQEARDLKAFRF